MEETVYKSMKTVGAWNIALGTIIIVVGVVTGILMLIGGGRLLSQKSKILF
ncbi:MAG: hypothetical protein R3Y54_07680 [Eubacteriales bacterium]